MQPTLLLSFAKTKRLDPRITFTRSGEASYDGADGLIKWALSGVPRFTHDPLTGKSLGFLPEESRTNLAINSEALSVGVGVTINADATVAPDGQTTMDEVVEDGSTGEHYPLDVSFTPTAGQYYVWSAFVKPGVGTRKLTLSVGGGASAVVTFDPIAKTFSAGSGAEYISSAFQERADGSIRVAMLWYATSAVASIARTKLHNGTTTSYTGDSASSLYVWGRQLELGTFASSYIRTSGTSVTRAADVALMTGTNFSEWYNPREGTVVCAIRNSKSPTQDSTTRLPWVISDGSYNNSMYLNQIPSLSYQQSAAVVSGGVVQTTLTADSYTAGADSIVAFGYKTNKCTKVKDGGTVRSDTSLTLPVAVTTLSIGSNWAGTGNIFSSPIAFLAYFPYLLTDAEHQKVSL